MFRKLAAVAILVLLVSVLASGLSAGATIAARRAASKMWRVATGEPPPVKR